MKNNYLECGKVINKRGISGELKLECYCDSPSSLFGAKKVYGDKDGKIEYKVNSIKEYKGFLYIKLEGITSAELADSLRGKVLFASREDIDVEEDSYFIADLIGLDVVDANSGKVYGKVKDVINYGASDIYVIKDGSNEFMMPAVSDMIVEVILDDKILVNPVAGIFDEAEEIRP